MKIQPIVWSDKSGPGSEQQQQQQQASQREPQRLVPPQPARATRGGAGQTRGAIHPRGGSGGPQMAHRGGGPGPHRRGGPQGQRGGRFIQRTYPRGGGEISSYKPYSSKQ